MPTQEAEGATIASASAKTPTVRRASSVRLRPVAGVEVHLPAARLLGRNSTSWPSRSSSLTVATPTSGASVSARQVTSEILHRRSIIARPAPGHASDLPAMCDGRVLAKLPRLEIETPSWGYGNSGTRFHLPVAGGGARRVGADLGRRARPSADRLLRERGDPRSLGPLDDWSGARPRRADDQGIRIGAVNANPLRRGRLPARGLRPSGRGGAAARARALSGVRRDRRAGRLFGRQPLARRRDELSRPGRPARALPPGPSLEELYAALPTACGSSSSTSSSSRRSTAPTCPTGAPRRSCAGA